VVIISEELAPEDFKNVLTMKQATGITRVSIGKGPATKHSEFTAVNTYHSHLSRMMGVEKFTPVNTCES